ECRRVGNDAQRVVMDVEFAADVLDHDALAGGVVHDVMRLRSEAPSAEHYRGDDDVADIGLHLLDAGEVLQDPMILLPTAQWSCPHRLRCRSCIRQMWESRTSRRPGLFHSTRRTGPVVPRR